MMEKSSLTPEKSSANAVLNIQREVMAGRLTLGGGAIRRIGGRTTRTLNEAHADRGG